LADRKVRVTKTSRALLRANLFFQNARHNFGTLRFSENVGHKSCKQTSRNFRDLFCQKWRHGVSDLMILLRSPALEKIIIRESLQASRLTHGHATPPDNGGKHSSIEFISAS
jgi:hypothetical protein